MSFDLQKATLSKRIAAWLLDVMLLLTLAAGFATGLGALLGFEEYQLRLDASYEQYQVQYGKELPLTQEHYDVLSKAEQETYQELVNEMSYVSDMIVSQLLLIISSSVFGGILVTEFVVPLILKNGQTLGKKAFGLGLVRPDGVRITGAQLFIRSILGKYALEIMIPAYVILMLFLQMGGIIGICLVLAIWLTQLGLLFFNRNKALIHDLLASTVVVDVPSQTIFASTDDLIAYKKKIHAEEVARKDY